MTIYIDRDFRCHLSGGEGRRPVETGRFDGRCPEYIEGYRFVPQGQTWTREDGMVFAGEMMAPWKPYDELDQAQREYERDLAQAALILLGEVDA